MSGKSTISGRGRKPKPTALKLLAGNPGKRKLNDQEPDFSKVTTIEPPKWLTTRASEMWQRIIPELLREKVLCLTDLHNVECFCAAYDKWRMSEEKVQEFGIIMQNSQGSPVKNPALAAANEAMSQMIKFGSTLGLNPADRSRLIGNKSSNDDNEFNEFF